MAESGMTTRVLTALAAVFLWVSHAAPCRAQPTIDAATLQQRRGVIDRWLKDAGLTDELEVLKLRRSEHPDPKAVDRLGYRLELRFITSAGDQQAQQEFQKFLTAQPSPGGVGFAERSFYHVVHLLDVDRAYASVHFYVAESEYAVYFDSSAREVVMRSLASRNVRRVFTVPLPRSVARSGALTIPKPSDLDAPRSIQRFLEAYFAATRTREAPSTTEVHHLEPDYLEVWVKGLRGQIEPSKKNWERLMLSIHVEPVDGTVKLTCLFDGMYAAGLGSNQPADDSYVLMAGTLSSALDAYAEKVLAKLREHFESGPR